MKFLDHQIKLENLVGKKIKIEGIKEAEGKKATIHDTGSDMFFRYELIFRKDENSVYRIALFGVSSPELNITEIRKSLFSKYKILNGSTLGEYSKDNFFAEEFEESDKFLKKLKL